MSDQRSPAAPRSGVVLLTIVAVTLASCAGVGGGDSTTTSSTTTSTGPTTTVDLSDPMVLAEAFIDAFYSFQPAPLRELPWADSANREEMLYYQGWAEGANYTILERRPCEAWALGAICKITVEDDLLLALGLDHKATDTFTLTIRDGQIRSVDTTADDPPVVGRAIDTVLIEKDLHNGPCRDMFAGGSTPKLCAEAVVAGLIEYAANQ